MKRNRVTLLAGLAFAAALVTALLAGLAAASTVARSAGPASFADPAGDANGAADITAVSLSTDASGVLTVNVTAVGYFGIDPAQEPEVDVYLDTDRNASTGAPGSGSEIDVYYWTNAKDEHGWDVEHWTGSKWEEMAQSPTMSFSRSGDTLSWRLGKQDLGGTGAGVNLFGAAFNWPENAEAPTAFDRAPDGGVWSYDTAPGQTTTQTTSTTPAPVKVRAAFGTAALTPAFPVAGRRFSLRVRVLRSDTGKPLTQGTMSCDPRVNGKLLAHTDSFAGGTAKLSLVVPKTLQGKLLQVKLSIGASGGTTARTFSFRIH